MRVAEVAANRRGTARARYRKGGSERDLEGTGDREQLR
jgi:hypothetical protein